MDDLELTIEYLGSVKKEIDSLINNARKAKLLGNYREARESYDKLHESLFEHTQLMGVYASELEEQAKKDPRNKEVFLGLKSIMEQSTSAISKHLNDLAIALALETEDGDLGLGNENGEDEEERGF